MAFTFDQKIFDDIAKEKQKWAQEVDKAFTAQAEWLKRFSMVSDREINRIYTPSDNKAQDFARDVGFPGEYPYTRGVQPSMYRIKLLLGNR